MYLAQRLSYPDLIPNQPNPMTLFFRGSQDKVGKGNCRGKKPGFWVLFSRKVKSLPYYPIMPTLNQGG